MGNSHFAGAGISEGVGSTGRNLEAGPQEAPAPGGPLVFSEQDQSDFDTGSGSPAVAINGAGLVISVHSSSGNFYYDRGTIGTTGGISWNKSRGTKYASGYGNATVAINQPVNNDSAVVITVYQQKQGKLYWSGALYNSAGQIDWFNQNVYLCETSSTPAVALTNDGIVVVAFLQGGTLYSQVGALQQKTILWGTPQIVYDNASACALAVNNNGDVLLCCTNSVNNLLVTACGTLDPASNSIDWSPSRRVALTSSGGVINLALDDAGNAIVTASPAGQPAYNVGTMSTDPDGHKTIEWLAMVGWLIPNLTADDTGMSVAANASTLAMLWQNKGKYYFSGVSRQW